MSNTETPGTIETAGGLLPRAGFIASAITTLCCLGLPAVVSLASAIGATFLTRDATLRPLLALTLTVTIVGSVLTYRRHRSLPPLLLTIAAACLVYAALYGPLDHGVGFTHGNGGNHAAQHDSMNDTMTTTASSHDEISATVLVWLGLGLLLTAQVWDIRRVHHCRAPRRPVSATGHAT